MRRAMGTILNRGGMQSAGRSPVGQEAAPAEQKNPKEGFPRLTYSISSARRAASRSTAFWMKKHGGLSRRSRWRGRHSWETTSNLRSEARHCSLRRQESLRRLQSFDPKPRKSEPHLSDRTSVLGRLHRGSVRSIQRRTAGIEFFVNPPGVQMDLSNNDVGGFEDETWDTLWSSAGRITPDGYIVEMAIPFGSLRFPKSAGVQTWGLDMVRIYPRSQRHRIGLSRLSRDKDCYICQHAKLTGFEGITPAATSSDPR